MADEMRLMFHMQVEKGFFKDSIPLGQLTFDINGIGARGGSAQEIGTVEETIDFGDIGAGTIATEGYLYIRNLDTSNFVNIGPQVGTGNGQIDIRLNAGDVFWCRVEPGSVWRAKADTAALLIDVRLYGD